MRRFFFRRGGVGHVETIEGEEAAIRVDDDEDVTRSSRCRNPGMLTIVFVIGCVALMVWFGYAWQEELVLLSATTKVPSCPSCAKNATGFELQRLCSEALYRCGRATVVFVHVHKGGGSTFVALAKANGAGLSSSSRNGDPTRWRNGPREEWWRLDAKKQRDWFKRMRRKGTRFVSTEKGFPTPDRLLPPTGIVYAIVVRDPVSRFVSYYFWRYRDTSVFGRAGRFFFSPASADASTDDVVATLRFGAPSFETFVESETPLDGYYVSRLLGKERSEDLSEQDVLKAVDVLETHFSIVLVTERLGVLGDPLVRAKLGWWTSSFDECRQKANPKPDLAKLREWRGADWHDELGRLMPLDLSFYKEAWKISLRQHDDLTGGSRRQNNNNASNTATAPPATNLVEVLP